MRTCLAVQTCAQVVLLVFPVLHTVSLGVAQHIAGNILHEIIYVVLADRGTVKSKLQDLWPVMVEGYRLDSATTRLGGHHTVHVHSSKQATPSISTAESQEQGD